MEKTKNDDQVWVRWFYVSNWSELKAVNKAELKSHIELVALSYLPEFKRKAVFEVIDGNSVKKMKAGE